MAEDLGARDRNDLGRWMRVGAQIVGENAPRPSSAARERVGGMNVLLLADTHLAEDQGARLVDKLGNHLEAADVIIHAGDVTDVSILTALEEVAPVRAVLGNNDRGMILPERLIV